MNQQDPDRIHVMGSNPEVAEAIAVAMETYPGGDQIRTSLAALLARQIGGLS